MPRLVTPQHLQAATRLRELISTYEEKRELVMLGAYRTGNDKRLDDALRAIEHIERFLQQPEAEAGSYEVLAARLAALTRL